MSNLSWLERITLEPSKATLDTMRMATILRCNDVIELVRELRDSSVLPEEQPEYLQKILTALSQLKAGLLIGGSDGEGK